MAFDPDSFLKETPDTTVAEPKSGFDPDKFLAKPESTGSESEASAADVIAKGLQTIAPAISGLVKGPVVPEGMVGKLASNPIGIMQNAADIASMAHGHPPYGAMIRNALPSASSFLNKPLAEAVPEYLQGLKQIPGQALNGAKNVIRGVGKLAGPVGLGMNAYDAAQYAQEAELGNRLAQGQGKTAEQNFRGLNTPINGPISPDQAQALLENGSPRDIEAAGGQARINELIRQKAAALALRPIAPQQ